MKKILVRIILITFVNSSSSQINQQKITTNYSWKEIGEVKANSGADHKALIVQGRFDNLIKVKFKVANTDLKMHTLV
jgi:hypothetical protein